MELRDERDARITNIIADANMDGVRHLGNDDPYARLGFHEFRKNRMKICEISSRMDGCEYNHIPNSRIFI